MVTTTPPLPSPSPAPPGTHATTHRGPVLDTAAGRALALDFALLRREAPTHEYLFALSAPEVSVADQAGILMGAAFMIELLCDQWELHELERTGTAPPASEVDRVRLLLASLQTPFVGDQHPLRVFYTTPTPATAFRLAAARVPQRAHWPYHTDCSVETLCEAVDLIAADTGTDTDQVYEQLADHAVRERPIDTFFTHTQLADAAH